MFGILLYLIPNIIFDFYVETPEGLSPFHIETKYFIDNPWMVMLMIISLAALTWGAVNKKKIY